MIQEVGVAGAVVETVPVAEGVAAGATVTASKPALEMACWMAPDARSSSTNSLR
jgi:hypothetical protein